MYTYSLATKQSPDTLDVNKFTSNSATIVTLIRILIGIYNSIQGEKQIKAFSN